MTSEPMKEIFDDRYPNVAWWCQEHGWIEVGSDEFSRSMIRVLDLGGMVWEGEGDYETVGEALEEADEFIAGWRVENGYAS